MSNLKSSAAKLSGEIIQKGAKTMEITKEAATKLSPHLKATSEKSQPEDTCGMGINGAYCNPSSDPESDSCDAGLNV
eukprot:6331787-Pyramimonas_sp.AAC.1